MIAAAAAALFLAASAAAQVCKKDLLVDDFGTSQQAVVDSATRFVNKLGGDYGGVGVEWNIDTTKKAVVIVSQNASSNFWFSKFDAGACFDLTGYSSIDFDLLAPTGSSMSFTLTQKLADCSQRAPDGSDSVYLPLSKYVTPDGTKKHVSLPLADFAKNINGANYDFIHLKDWTPVSFAPSGATFEISNIVLKGGCGVPGTGTNTGSSSSPTSAASGSSPTGTTGGSGSTAGAQKGSAESFSFSAVFASLAAGIASLAFF
ncbi:hypothetical protein HK105_201788 [Polyrhizophydium stewartii]|uniref:Uncharacterized protein n=1 Tax=Polyrhizophydium stewartii TaxID=2732419 RepID=A0ABR4NFT0_9FUNG